VRFYKLPINTSTHTGHLWTAGGTLLGTVTFSGETASGWQQANFASPIAITAGTTYVVSYFTPGGRYANDQNFFNAAVNTGGLHALASGGSGGNGVYLYTGAGGFPNNSYLASNYWVDVVFNTTVPPTATPTNTPTQGPTATPTATSAPQTCPCTLFAPSTSPAAGGTDPGSVELGMKFVADQSGFVRSVRFYKLPINTSTHTGHLWTASGTLLGTVTFTGETASGWQQADFASPIAITAGTTYVVSYFTPGGRYAVDQNFFATTLNNGVLHAPSSASSGGNGVYLYTGAGGFPNNSYQASNYWVDVVYSQ